LFMRGHFKAQSQNDCFVHLDGFKKGCVYINGFNIGRYWEIGPQRALYIPGVLLKDENEIIILELEGCEKAEVEINAEPDLG
ncbi:MAG: beta-galactosidase, partial [Oscillospiraceae bacterium]|nr:beta-galactosidase [Oscillospiraceae bacterium]